MRLQRVITSRRLAVACLLAIAIFGLVGTLVPQGDPTMDAEVRLWLVAHPIAAPVVATLGLTAVYTSAPFILTLLVTVVSTGGCAWERTSSALRTLKLGSSVSPSAAARLRDRPTFAVPVGESPDPLGAVERAMRGARLRIVRGPSIVQGSSGLAGLAGSPLFHWSLVALMLVIMLGQLSRSEGMMGVPEGTSRRDASGAYGRVSEGPLYRGHSGLDIGVSDFVRDYVDEQGVARGAAPVVTLSEGGRPVARGRVYPNAPLRYGSLLIHMNDMGYSPVLSVESTSGETMGSESLLVDIDSADQMRTIPTPFDLTRQGSAPLALSAEVLLPSDTTRTLTVEDLLVDVRFGPSREASSHVLALGQKVVLPGGLALRYAKMRRYARLSIADDWSIYPIYALFAIAAIGLTLALLVPYRVVRALVVRGVQGDVVNVVVSNRRGSPAFADKIERSIRDALGAREEESDA